MPVLIAELPRRGGMLMDPHETNVGTWVVPEVRGSRYRLIAEFVGEDARREAMNYAVRHVVPNGWKGR